MATGLTASELRSSSPEELVSKLAEAKEELFNLRFQSATGQLESHGRLRAVKRDIARIYTVIRERELGIRATPAPLDPAAKAKRATKKTEAADEAPAANDAAEETTEAADTVAAEKAP